MVDIINILWGVRTVRISVSLPPITLVTDATLSNTRPVILQLNRSGITFLTDAYPLPGAFFLGVLDVEVDSVVG